MSFCGNFVELVEKERILSDTDFERWIDTNINHNDDIEVYVEKTLIPELEKKPIVIISASVGNLKGKEVGVLFIKRDSNTYGL